MVSSSVQEIAGNNHYQGAALSRLRQQFSQLYGDKMAPRLFYAPGRVNLIGEHTDYNDGFVLPIAINMGTVVLGATTPDPHLTVYAANLDETLTVDLSHPVVPPSGHWSAYVVGMAILLQQQGFHLKGAHLLIDGNVPVGCGLSSSASLECAVGFALLALADLPVDKTTLALTGQQAEHAYAGTECGIMDQLISALGKPDHALFIDCRSLHAYPIPMGLTDLTFVICNSGVTHKLSASAYNTRRQECARGVHLLRQVYPEVNALRDVSLSMLAKARHVLVDDTIRRRVSHVVHENARTVEAARALQQHDFDTFGLLMNASHVSLRTDYEVSCPELDALVDIAQSLEGVLGSRMTGGGFGGCTINLVRQQAVPLFLETVGQHYQQQFNRVPDFYITPACEGVREIIG